MNVGRQSFKKLLKWLTPHYDKRIDAVGVTLLLLFWTVFGYFSLIYPKIRLAENGVLVEAEIKAHLPNSADVTDKATWAPFYSQRHLIEVKGKEYEVVLQNAYLPHNAYIKWLPETEEAVVTNAEGEYSLMDAIGGKAGLLFFSCYFIMLFHFPFSCFAVYQSFLNHKKKN